MRRVIMAVVAVVATAAVVGMLPTASEVAIAAPATVAVVQSSRDHAPEPDAPYYAVRLFEDESDPDTLHGVDAPADAEVDAYGALISHGARGAMNDDYSAVYVRVGTVVDFGNGTITVTTSGPAMCMDGTDTRCTGREFLTAEWQTY